MKIKSSLLFTIASTALIGFAMADTTTFINITGSTAGRAKIHSELTSASGPLAAFNGGVAPTFTYYTVSGSTAAASKGDGYIYFASTGTTPNKVNTIVRCYWAGSASGVNYVSNQTQLDYKFLLPDQVSGTNTQLTGTAADLQTAGKLAPASADTVSTFGFSDVKQAATPYQTVALAEQTDMYVLPFRWVKTDTTDLSGVTNITSQQARVHYNGGGLTKLSLFTGVAADASKDVYAVGRDGDSGTRITTLAETGAGVFTELFQWAFTVGNNGTPLDKNDDVITDPVEVFNEGYASGGDVASRLGATGYNAIGYVGTSDASTAITQGGLGLKYNGVDYSVDAVKNGSYTFWSKYQAIRKQTLSGAAHSVFTSLKDTLVASASTSDSIKLTDMQVDRQSDGADVTPK